MNNRINVIQDDITQLDVDAIVNAANSGLRGGGGVDGAIHRAGGPDIMEECRKIDSCPTGEAVVTTGGNLKAKFVIHTVGPVWRGGNLKEEELLAGCYRNSLKRAMENHVRSIAFPNISTGIYSFPKHRAAAIAVQEIQHFLATNESIRQITFCCFDRENYDLYVKLLQAETGEL
jgi:O-acetyl-ADP-ribose deacetylase